MVPNGHSAALTTAKRAGYTACMHAPRADEDRTRWNARYRAGQGPRQANPRLRLHLHELAEGRVLDLAGGVGANARLFTNSTVIVADVSEAALQEALSDGASGICAVQVDARRLPFAPGSFDTIVCTYFFEPAVEFAALLRPGGSVFFETYTQADERRRPTINPAFLYDADRARTLFQGLQVMFAANTDDGRRAYTTIIARMPASRTKA